MRDFNDDTLLVVGANLTNLEIKFYPVGPRKKIGTDATMLANIRRSVQYFR